MSKVQSSKSETEESEAVKRGERDSAAVQGEEADVGHWRVDIGLEAEIGHPKSDTALSVSDLRKSFLSPNGERIEVLRGASFSANPGETVAIMGASGAGKSTLLHLLGALEAADHGSIALGKFAIDGARTAALSNFRNSRVGFVFQFHHLLPDLTAAENVSLPLMIARTSRRAALQRAKEMLEHVNLGDRLDHPTGQLSGGEQQRVAVCRALVTRPELVLADEPTGNLDTEIGSEIAQSLISYGRVNKAIVVLATHNRSLAELCDRMLVLWQGRLALV